jgi:hypothetical protein
VVALRPMLDRPFLLSTSRHVTQGMIEVREERWDAAARTLTGRSEVVRGDGYELRIALPETPRAWRATTVELDSAATATGATARLLPERGCVRVRLDVLQTREVAWTVRCAEAPAEGSR